MPIMQSQSATVEEFHRLREELGMSYQQIVDFAEANGESVSLATVKRVFSTGSEGQKFRPETVNAIGKVLFDEKLKKQQNTENAPSHEIEALNSLLAFNELTIENLEKECERLRADYEKKLTYVKTESEKMHEHIVALTEQSAINIQHLKAKDRAIFGLALGLIGLLLLICAVLVIDVLNTDIGFIRTFTGNGPLAIAGIAAVLVLVVIVYFTAKKHQGKTE